MFIILFSLGSQPSLVESSVLHEDIKKNNAIVTLKTQPPLAFQSIKLEHHSLCIGYWCMLQFFFFLSALLLYIYIKVYVLLHNFIEIYSTVIRCTKCQMIF